ncbi:MAG: hypothetical protein ACW99G_20390 [Candidatus Thorarchaeota archaeon]|jgi:hypothetical protein
MPLHKKISKAIGRVAKKSSHDKPKKDLSPIEKQRKKIKKKIKKQNKAGVRKVSGRVLQGIATLGAVSAPKEERGTAVLGAVTLAGIGEAMVQAEKRDRKKKKRKLKRKLKKL